MLKKIVLTGAAGRLGGYLRKPLAAKCETLVSTDIAPLTDPLIKGRVLFRPIWQITQKCRRLSRARIWLSILAAIPMKSRLRIFCTPISLAVTISGRPPMKQGCAGLYMPALFMLLGCIQKQQPLISTLPIARTAITGWQNVLPRIWPSFTGIKGLEAVCLRILSCANVTNSRALGSWLSYDDLIHLVERAVDTPTTGFAVIYGVSNNDRSPVDNSGASFLGYRPRDNAEQFAEDILANAPEPDPRDPDQMMHGGPFATTDLGESGVAKLGHNQIDYPRTIIKSSGV